MKIKSISLLALAVLLSGGAVRPQTTQATDANARVTFDPLNTVNVVLGKSTPVAFTFHIKPGFHVNSNKPISPELIPTQLGFTPPEDLVLAKMHYPAGVLTSFPFDPTEKLSVYSGDLTVKAVVIPAPKANAGNYTVHGELKYQACDNSACYPPKRLPIQFDVKIVRGSAASHKARPNAQSPHIHN